MNKKSIIKAIKITKDLLSELLTKHYEDEAWALAVLIMVAEERVKIYR